ncbi:PVC-type heme-binding CxxCH protein [Rhodopirellula sp. P2]|uniref:PVC-type heme-binding CxxCH protein n=1 Tax=Rhodopirellula sp. P2 TaxID=2127060 RepID=UPI002368393B|nr:PVC-type heme-binding CxxCH protein [Rhodopirellula sp. P2]WDQ15289.1 FG-GAP-like repeat-containing protein [Rhodopirellula sp. P2]
MNLFAFMARPTSLSCSAILGCAALLLGLLASPVVAQQEPPRLEDTHVGWESQQISDQFFAEGSAVGDLNGDGLNDLVYGPVWFAGPDFQAQHALAEPNVVPVAGYSQHFFSHVCDVNDDGHPDVISIGFPGRNATLYINPGEIEFGADSPTWKSHIIAPRVSNESPAWVHLLPGGLPELVCARDRVYGYYTADDLDDPTQPWKWVAISEPGTAIEPFGHGLGVGDIDGDGRNDIIDRQHWWKHPDTDDSATKTKLWQRHSWIAQPYGGGGAQIHVHDFDGDGDSDLVTSKNAHGYGLAWFEQTAAGQFVPHEISGESSMSNPHGYATSQMHALEAIDVDGDGRRDIVTGKRYLAHAGKDPGGLQAPLVVWFRNVKSDRPGGIEFIPHIIHETSGVGVEVIATDINGDGRVDVLTGNKKGLTVHFQTDLSDVPQDKRRHVAERWRTPKLPQTEYATGLSPTESALHMNLPDGFEVDVIASEPELVQPIAMCFDDRGRIWMIEGNTYPTKAPEGEGKDRILILEDSDGDGSFETHRVFAEGLNLASGIEVGFGGVWIGAAPELLFYPDADRDDVPDAEPTVLLDGWGYQDTHETLNSFTWGMDGWLYGCHGVFTHSNVGKPGTAKADRTPLNAGVWRYHPVRHEFEVFAHGTSNPWGVDFNEDGDWFISACVIPHLFHLSHGGRYFRQAGQHFNPHTYDDIKTIADHLHYGDGTFQSANSANKVDRDLVRRTVATTSMVGGGHAHAGLTIYQADEFPAHYRGELFFHNLHGHRIVREHLETEGSGYIGRHRPDFMLSHDHEQIGVGIMQGPDGALYSSDWHDDQTCHHRDHEIWDRTNGRLFRIRYGDLQPYRFDLSTQSVDQLVDNLKHSNAYFVRQSQRILQERAAAGTLDRAQLASSLTAMVQSELPRRQRLQAVWTAWTSGLLSVERSRESNHVHVATDLATLLDDSDPVIRGWAVQLIGEGHPTLSNALLGKLERMAATESSPVTRRHLASFLQRIPESQRLGLASGLLNHVIDQNDRNLPWLIWYGIEPVIDVDPAGVMSVVSTGNWQPLQRFVTRRTATTPEGRQALVASIRNKIEGLDKDATVNNQFDWMLEELLQSARSRGGVAMPDAWPQVSQLLREKASATSTKDLAGALAIQFGDASALPELRKILTDPAQLASSRMEALRLLAQAKDPELGEMLLTLIDDRDIGSHAVRGLASYDSPKIAPLLIERFQAWSPQKQSDALATLTSRTDSAIQLIAAMEENVIPPTIVPAYAIRNVLSLPFEDDTARKRLEAAWGRIGATSEQAKQRHQKYAGMLTPAKLASANRTEGKKLYEVNCGKCHRLFGEGEPIGPDLTGANRSDVNYWLENILQPNAVIGNAYQMTTFLLADGRVVSGLVRSRNEDAVTVQTTSEISVLPLEDVEIEKLSETSLMPEGQLEPLTANQVRDLFGYLMSPGPAYTREWAIEAESLIRSADVQGGQIQDQNMKPFHDQWSADNHLWWTGGQVGSTLTLTVPHQINGPAEIQMHLTGAIDYATLTLKLNEQPEKSFDGFSRDVKVMPPITWDRVELSPAKPVTIQIKITGKNEQAIARWMAGIDTISIRPLH